MRSVILYGSLCYFSLAITNLTGQEATTLISSAIYEEEVNGNLESAIGIYTRIVNEYPGERRVAAEALLRLGITHEKLGRTKAKEYYLQLLNNYSDQVVFVSRARSRLQQLNVVISVLKDDSIHSPDGPDKGPVRIYKVLGEEIDYFAGSISPNGKYFSYNRERELGIYERETGKSRSLTKESNELVSNHPSTFCRRSVWSRDGRKIAFTWRHEYNGTDLRIYDLEKEEYEIIYPASQKVEVELFEWTRDGGAVLVSILGENESKIALIDATNGSENVVKTLSTEQLTSGNRMSISPDGNLIIYDQTLESGKRNLFLLSVDGTIDRPLVTDLSDDRIAVWLAGGKTFLYISDLSGGDAFWKATLTDDGHIAHKELILDGMGDLHKHAIVGLTNNGVFHYLTVFEIRNLFTREIDDQNLTLGQPQLIVSDDSNQRWRPSWSPDGSKLGYMRFFKDSISQFRLEIRDMQTGQEQLMHFDLKNEGGLGMGFPEWSPTSPELMLTYFPKNSYTRWCILADTETGLIRPIIEKCHWQTFGKNNNVFYVTSHNIIEYDINTGSEEIIYTSLRNIYHLSLSPNGQELVFYEGPLGAFKNKDLIMLSLNDRSLSTIWSSREGEQFTMGSKPNWLNDSLRLLVSVSDDPVTTQQLYLFNVQSGTKQQLGEPIYGKKVMDGLMYNIRIHSDNKRIVYGWGRGRDTIWALENY